jgi:hypothetical protein
VFQMIAMKICHLKGHLTQNLKYTFFNLFQCNKTKNSTRLLLITTHYDNLEHRGYHNEKSVISEDWRKLSTI